MAQKLNQQSIPYRLKVAVINSSDKSFDLAKLSGHLEILLDTSPENTNSLFSFVDKKSKKILSKLRNTPIEFGFYSTLSTEAEIECVFNAYQITDKKARIEVFPGVPENQVPDFLKNPKMVSKYKELVALDTNPYFSIKKHVVSEDKTNHLNNIKLSLIDICDIVLFIGKNEKLLIEYTTNSKKPVFIYSQTKGFEYVSKDKINLEAVKRLERFNNHKVKKEVLVSKIENNLSRTFPITFFPEGNDTQKFYLEKRNILEKYYHPFFARAEILSAKYQKLYKNTGKLAYLSATLAVLFVALGLVYNLNQFKHVNFVVEFVLLVVILLIVTNAEEKRAHHSWLETRFLAERMRCAQFFYFSGIDINENQLHPYATNSSQDDWVIRAFDEIWYELQKKPKDEELKIKTLPELKAFISKEWIDDQINFHKGGAKKHTKNNKSYELTGKYAYFLALICAFLHSIPLLDHSIHYHPQFDATMVLLALILPAIGAMTEGVRRLLEFSRNAKRYKGMEMELNKIKFRFDNSNDPIELKNIMHQTDHLMMREVQDWMLIQSTNKLEPVV